MKSLKPPPHTVCDCQCEAVVLLLLSRSWKPSPTAAQQQVAAHLVPTCVEPRSLSMPGS